VPYGGQSSWNSNGAFQGNRQFPGAVDGVQRWYTIEGELRSMFITAGAAYSFGKVSIGITANAIDTVVNSIQARTAPGDDDLRNEGRAWLEAQSWNFSAGFGATYTPIPGKLRFGLSYQSRPGFGGGIEAAGTLHTLLSGSRSDSKVVFTTDLPDIVRGGALYRPSPAWEARLFGDYERWSVLERQCIFRKGSRCDLASDGSARPGSDVILATLRDWNDTFAVRAGGSYFMGPRTELFAGAGFASKAVPDETLEPALLDFDFVSVSGGAIFGLGKQLHLGASYTQVIYLPRDTTGKSVHPTLAAPSRSPDSGGKYALALGFVNLNLDFAF